MGRWLASSHLHALAKRLGDLGVDYTRHDQSSSLLRGVLTRRNGGSHNSNSSNQPNSNPPSSLSIAISLGVAIPVIVAICVFIWLHRRNSKQLRLEDKNDKHGSLDFGLGEVSRRSKNKRRSHGPEMSVGDTERMLRRANKGMSMDMGSPFVLPGELEDPRPSFHSLSRSAHDSEDPYRPVAFAKDPGASRSTSRRGSASMFTESSTTSPNGPRPARSSSKQNPQDREPNDYLSPTPPSELSPIEKPEPARQVTRKPVGRAIAPSNDTLSSEGQSRYTGQSESRSAGDLPPLPPLPALPSDFSIPPLPTFDLPDDPEPEPEPASEQSRSNRSLSPRSPTPPLPEKSPARAELPANEEPVNRVPSSELHAPQSHHRTPVYSTGPFDENATYADILGIAQSGTFFSANDQLEPFNNPDEPYSQNAGLGVTGFPVDNRRISASMRPLPPEDPADNAEQRANRIRSFYREYFDEHKHREDDYGFADYYEDYGQEYTEAPTFFDHDSGQFIVSNAPFNAPYAEPVTRRAMTPPPRAPPRFNPHGPYAPRNASMGQFPYQGRGLRAFSSSSGRPLPPPGYRGRPMHKPMPPPAPLSNLPTPHLLKSDSAIFTATDFAPPQSARDRQAGRPDSPFANKRPYSPSVRAYSPLTSAYDDLAAMPSPHHLRKSGTFTALDFAPPPRFKTDSGSDAGSIRSGRSGRSNLSASQVANIRAGAYRLSRVPIEVVGTRDDFAASLRPTWKQREAAI